MSLFAFVSPPGHAANLPAGFAEDLMAGGLSSPTAMALAPDGRIFVCQQGGQLRVIKNGALLPAPFVSLTVDSAGERGLLGVALDPNFATNNFVYVYYTEPVPAPHNRVMRFTASGDVALGGSATIIFELSPLRPATNHNGGAMHFGPDGKLYIAVGDNATGGNAQNLGNIFGKMLRINSDGSIPTDNPFYNQTSNEKQAIWAYGLRNPYTFAFLPGTSRMFINDVGQDAWEEINDGIAGANYGWPNTEGPIDDPNSPYEGPLYAYPHTGGEESGCAVTGGAFYKPSTAQFPSDYTGDYFFADFCSGWVRRYDVASDTTTGFATGISFPVDLRVDAQGFLYYLSRGSGGVYRIRYTGSLAPHISTQPAPQTAPVGGSATFSVTASGSMPLTYQWQRNGANISGATGSSYTRSPVAAGDNGAQFRVIVTNAHGSATSNSAALTVSNNKPPVPAIVTPAEGSLYSAGETINYSGSSMDPEQGSLPASAFTWRVDFHHDDHSHPFIPDTIGSKSGSFTVPTTGETSPNVWYRIHLTLKDAQGATGTTFRDVLPRKVKLTLATNPAGLQVKLDDQPIATPYVFTGVVGMTRTLGAINEQFSNGNTYEFVSWSDGGVFRHPISTPAADKTYTALYKVIGTDNAEFVSQSVPSFMLVGKTYPVTVTMKNTGTTVWNPGRYFLGSQNPQDNMNWGMSRVWLASSVPPGSNAVIQFNVKAPAARGDYNFRWRMIQDGVAWFGGFTPNAVVQVRANSAQFVAQSVPGVMLAGRSYVVAVTMKNTGVSTWQPGGYALGSQNPQDNGTWGFSRVGLPASVAPGASVTFQFTVKAPSAGGTYNFRWRMIQQGVEWFGDLTPNVAVQVRTNNAQFVSQNVPAGPFAMGQSVNVSVTMKNTGTTAWLRGAYFLGSQNPQDNKTWGLSRVWIPSDVAPGATVTIPFTIKAPAVAGTYNFQWKMVHEGIQWFGAASFNQSRTVQ